MFCLGFVRCCFFSVSLVLSRSSLVASTLVAALEYWQILFGAEGAVKIPRLCVKVPYRLTATPVSSAVVGVLRKVKGTAGELLGRFAYFHLFSGVT